MTDHEAPDASSGAAGSAAVAPRHWLDALLERSLAPLAAFGAIVVVGGTQGGYFPTSWGPSTVVLIALVGAWLALGARTDAGWTDGAFLAVLLLLLSWVGLSIAWSDAPVQSVLEAQRLLVLVAGVAAVLVLAVRSTSADIAFAVAAGITLLCGYALATRLVPGELGTYNPIAGYRLSEPVGYWNGLGILAVIGLVLSAGLAVEGARGWQRIPASVSLVVLAPTLYFTFSRGAWVALCIGAASMMIASNRRLRSVGALLIAAPAPALAVFAASRASGLTRTDRALEEAVDDGQRLILILVLLGALAVISAVVVDSAAHRLHFSPRAQRSIGLALAAAAAICLVGVFGRFGTPWSIAERAISAFEQPPADVGADLNNRLFSFSGSGRVDLWRSALETFEKQPVLGVGAGGFERSWQRDPRWTFKARDAHNLYLETLAELGPIGLVVLLTALLLPVGACLAARRAPVVPAALGAFVAYAVHAAADWDWELAGVTLAALLAGSVGLIARRSAPVRRLPRVARTTVGLAVVLVATGATWGFLGNDALDKAEYALKLGNPEAAISESRTAQRFAPWSPFPATMRGEALLAQGDVRAAHVAFREATRIDDGYWRAWLGLAVASSGRERTVALRRARGLYPRSAEIAETERLLRGDEGSGATTP